MLPQPTIEAFDDHLFAHGLRLEAVIVGGTALSLLGLITRPTRDVDVLLPELPPMIADIAKDFADTQRRAGVDLADDWLNNGPVQLGDVLPAGWQLRLRLLFEGRALVLRTLGQSDLLKAKLFALCDRGTDFLDCVALAPTASELAEVLPWLFEQDANPDWPAHVRATLIALGRRLDHGV